jgi:L-ascorbate metabolism protein UlaG (beta-lactamase superfamily)
MTVNGEALIREINSRRVPRGQMAVWWLGQHSFVVKAGETIVYLDPFLSPLEGRRIPPLLDAKQITHAALICGTHDHADHIDRPVWPALAQASPGAKFVVPEALREGLAEDLSIAPDRFIGLDDGITIEQDGAKISAIPAAHEFLDTDPATGRHRYLGYILEANGCTLYHAGDTCLYEGLHEKLRRWRLDAMLLPINGRDAKRYAAGIIGNMTYQEAADLAGSLRPGVVIPTHYEMFAGNLGDAPGFAEYVAVKYPHQAVHVCTHGESFVVRAARD